MLPACRPATASSPRAQIRRYHLSLRMRSTRPVQESRNSPDSFQAGARRRQLAHDLGLVRQQAGGRLLGLVRLRAADLDVRQPARVPMPAFQCTGLRHADGRSRPAVPWPPPIARKGHTEKLEVSGVRFARQVRQTVTVIQS